MLDRAGRHVDGKTVVVMQLPTDLVAVDAVPGGNGHQLNASRVDIEAAAGDTRAAATNVEPCHITAVEGAAAERRTAVVHVDHLQVVLTAVLEPAVRQDGGRVVAVGLEENPAPVPGRRHSRRT